MKNNFIFQEFPMLAQHTKENINFIGIVLVLRALQNDQLITAQEYNRAKAYYRKLTGADIVIAD